MVLVSIQGSTFPWQLGIHDKVQDGDKRVCVENKLCEPKNFMKISTRPSRRHQLARCTACLFSISRSNEREKKQVWLILGYLADNAQCPRPR